jgi:hypothetical protein
MYVNGGALIAKRQLLVECPWNELLFWNQGEDVELTRRMKVLGITPRLAPYVVLETDEPREGYTQEFLPPLDKDSSFLESANRRVEHTLLSFVLWKILSAKPVKSLFRSTGARYLLQTKAGLRIKEAYGDWRSKF